MRFCELRNKEVINIRTGERLGYIIDIEFDPTTYEIDHIIIPGPTKMWRILGRDCEYVIPFACIDRIGPDVVIINIIQENYLVKIPFV